MVYVDIIIQNSEQNNFSSNNKIDVKFILSTKGFMEKLDFDEYLKFIHSLADKGIRKKYNVENKKWTVHVTSLENIQYFIDNCQKLQKKFSAIQFEFNKQRLVDLKSLLDNTNDNNDIKYKLSSALQALPEINIDDNKLQQIFKKSLLKFQKVPLQYWTLQKSLLLADDMGIGKTIQALSVISYYQLYPAIIICPNMVKINWKTEIDNFFVQPPKYLIVDSKKINTKNIDNIQWNDYDIIIVNYEMIKKLLPYFKKVDYKIVICDEGHYIKNYKSQRSKAILSLARKKNIGKMLLSATPVINYPIELINQLRFLDKLNDFDGREAFISKYCDPVWNGYGWEYGSNNEEDLQVQLRNICMIRRMKVEVLPELPEKIIQNILVTINTDDYKKIARKFLQWTSLSSFDNNNISKLNNEIQNSLYNESMEYLSELRQVVIKAKIPLICDWINDTLNEGVDKLVVFGYHRQPLIDLHNLYKDKSCLVIGGQSDNMDRIKQFELDPEKKILFISLMIGGLGLNLQFASYMLFIEMFWTPAQMNQAEDRLLRIGQKNAVNIYYMLAENTIDMYVYDVVKNKEKSIKSIMDLEELIKFLQK